MSRTTSFTTRIIASSADLAVYTNGAAVFSTPVKRGAKVRPLASPGQWVFMNVDTQLSTGTTATPATVPNLAIGVAIGSNGIAEYIRWFNDGFKGCQNVRDLKGRESNCGLGNITDIFFGCIECGQTYTVKVVAYDPITEALGYGEGKYEYTFSYTPGCGDCASGDCPSTTVSADQVMCGLYNKIKGIENDPNWDIKLNNFPIPRDHEYRFDVAKLYDGSEAAYASETTFEYCLTQTSGECADCNNFTAIGGYSLDGDPDVVFSPSTFLTDNGTVVSRRAHIDSAIEELNVALAGNGNAVLLPAVGNCCSTHKIEVNTCLESFELHSNTGAVITPCAKSNPFSAVTVYNECQDCDNANTTRTFTAGLRFYSRPVESECTCVNGSTTLPSYFHEIEVYTIGFDLNGGIYKNVRQTSTIPEGQGFTWVARELGVLENGNTEPFVYGIYGGKWGLDVKSNDLLAQATVDCEKAYCSIQWLTEQKTDHTNIGTVRYFPETDIALIPTNHATAKASFLTAINAYFAGSCGPATVTCAA